MKILLVGSGAREHALAWRLAKCKSVTALWCAPGNAGMAVAHQCLPLDAGNPHAVINLAQQLRVDLVVIGPEGPLVAGVADALRRSGIPVFGPDAAAAQIEGSKAFAKEVMASAGVPTARYVRCETVTEARDAVDRMGAVVVKADGLAQGKGVVVAHSREEALAAVHSLAATPAGRTLVLEEVLEGPEVSVIVLTDGERSLVLPAAQDHKQLFDGDRGPNTGGMGAYAPYPPMKPQLLDEVRGRIIDPLLAELRRRGARFQGALYAGLMLTREGPKVIEFNCRFGDPETQPLMMLLDDDLAEVLLRCAQGSLPADAELKQRSGYAVGVVLASKGYPSAPSVGEIITGLEAPLPRDVEVFHAGTTRRGSQWATAGGRVVTVCAVGATLPAARALAYGSAEAIQFPGRQLRRDIGARDLPLP